ncbi:hypothetical protein G6F35_013117 [Rhizopus arrhizus]|nr:hypothetical protein G6F35_013117 [Rhizopus arrhizus]KAG1392399.1 hypothetical protein G6F58_012519 [Rhizopus delemar]
MKCQQGSVRGLFDDLHPPPHRHLAVDGGAVAAGHPRLPQAAGVGAAGNRCTQPGGHHPVPRRQRHHHGLAGHHATGAPVRADLRAGADDLRLLGRVVDDHPAVLDGPRHRHRRAGRAGGDPPGHPALVAALPAGLQPGEPGRRGHRHPEADL